MYLIIPAKKSKNPQVFWIVSPDGKKLLKAHGVKFATEMRDRFNKNNSHLFK